MSATQMSRPEGQLEGCCAVSSTAYASHGLLSSMTRQAILVNPPIRFSFKFYPAIEAR